MIEKENNGVYTQFYVGGTITVGEVIEVLQQIDPSYKLLVDGGDSCSWSSLVERIVANHDRKSVYMY